MKSRITLALALLLTAASAVMADDLKIKEGFVSLFDGKTLAGWTQKNGTATYRVEGGTIAGQTTKGSPNSFGCNRRPAMRRVAMQGDGGCDDRDRVARFLF